MTEFLEPTPDAGPPLVSAELVDQARAFAANARAPRTRHEYQRAWRTFNAWCAQTRQLALPAAPETVALYLTARATAGRKPATLEQDLSAIAAAHRFAGHVSPRKAEVVIQVRAGIRRALSVAPVTKAPLLAGEIKDVVAALPNSLQGLRDRALLLVGFAGAFRRSELVAIAFEDLQLGADGLRVLVRRSKTDQEGEGRTVGIPRGGDACPVSALHAWLVASAIDAGPIFREVTKAGQLGAQALSGRSVARIVKRAAAAAGLDPDNLAGHSLRAGLATSAAQAGATERAIMRQTGHHSAEMVRRYIRDAEVLGEDNAARGLL
jgi:site-specific recombinase XerD